MKIGQNCFYGLNGRYILYSYAVRCSPILFQNYQYDNINLKKFQISRTCFKTIKKYKNHKIISCSFARLSVWTQPLFTDGRDVNKVLRPGMCKAIVHKRTEPNGTSAQSSLWHPEGSCFIECVCPLSCLPPPVGMMQLGNKSCLPGSNRIGHVWIYSASPATIRETVVWFIFSYINFEYPYCLAENDIRSIVWPLVNVLMLIGKLSTLLWN